MPCEIVSFTRWGAGRMKYGRGGMANQTPPKRDNDFKDV